MNTFFKNKLFFLVLSSVLGTLISCRQLGENSTESILKSTTKKFGINIAEDISTDLQKHIVNSKISEAQVKLLRKDIASSKTLKEILNAYPQLLTSYSKLSHLSKKFRTDTRILQWDASLDKIKYNSYKARFRNLKLTTDELNQTLIIKEGDQTLAEYSNGVFKANAGRFDKVSGLMKGNNFLNTPLAADATYILDHQFVYKTDQLGRVFQTDVIKPLELKDRGRDIFTQRYVNVTKDGILREGNGLSDNAGHIIAQRLNGPSEMINFFPQLPAMNIGDWKIMENTLVKAVSDGRTVTIKYFFSYADFSARPSSIRTVYRIDKSDPVELVFNN